MNNGTEIIVRCPPVAIAVRRDTTALVVENSSDALATAGLVLLGLALIAALLES